MAEKNKKHFFLTKVLKYDINNFNMRWKKNGSKRPYILDLFISKEIVYNAYLEGYINWNIYYKALDKINSNINGSWMFEKSCYINFNRGKVYGE